MKMPRQQDSNRGGSAALPLWLPWFLLVLVVSGGCSWVTPVDAITQTAAIDVHGRTTSTGISCEVSYTVLASQASFGSWPPMGAEQNQARQLQLPPSDNPLLCNDVTSTSSSTLLYRDSILLAPRGTCTFETKAWHAQQLGARAVIIYGTLASRYALNETTTSTTNDASQHVPTESDIVYPTNLHDYDCSNGAAWIPKSQLSFDPLPYNAQRNDFVLQGENSLCRKLSADHQLQNCASQACLLTGNVVKEEFVDNNDEEEQEKGGVVVEKMEACCAWDFHIWLYNDVTAFNATTQQDKLVTIPAVYVTMQQGHQLLQDLQEYNSDFTVTIYARWRPSWNPSSMMIWALGVTIAALAAYLSAQDYHSMIAKTMRRQAARLASSGDEQRRRRSSAQQQQQPPRSATSSAHGEQSLELTAAHALGFIIMASTSLLVLFYFKIYGIVKVMYALGCSKAVSTILFHPLTNCVFLKTGIVNKIVIRTGTEDFGDVTLVDIVSHVAGYTIGFVWLYIALTVRHAETVTFFWITQDVFGACMCIMFLQVIKLNSMRVASILLSVAFFYDIFFVFISPLIFSKSVMMDVATSGGPPTADPLWCEKYPDDKNCQGGDPLPMLLTIPRLLDYQGGSSLLGLGDIVLPGLLLSFAARYDASKSLLGVMGGGHGNLNSSYACPERKLCYNCTLCSGGYFWPAVLAYAVGLCMANMAVYLMEMGQPALLYLVPCCLGTVLGMGYRRNEVKELWDGPKIIRAADAIVYPDEYQQGDGSTESSAAKTHHEPLPQTDADDDDAVGLNVPTIPSARDDNDDHDDDLDADGRGRK
jgi:signal peptide peptidase-like 2B